MLIKIKIIKKFAVVAFTALLLPGIGNAAGMNLTVCGASPGGSVSYTHLRAHET